MATQLILPTVTAGTGSTPVQLITTRTPCNGFIVQAHPSNSDTVWIGDSSVSASSSLGIRLEVPVSGATLPFISIGESTAPDAINLSDYYVISSSSGQKVNVLFVVV